MGYRISTLENVPTDLNCYFFLSIVYTRINKAVSFISSVQSLNRVRLLVTP